MPSPLTRRRHPPRRHLEAALRVIAAAGLWLLWEVVFLGFVRLPPATAITWLLTMGMLFLWAHALPWGWSPARARASARVRPVPRRAWRWLAVMAPVVPAGALALGLMLAALGVRMDESFPPEVERFLARPGGPAVLALHIVVFAPLLEEFAFRGWMQRPLERRYGAWPAMLATAVLFALAHFQPEGIPIRLIGGLALGWVVWATRSLWAGVALHAAWNLGVIVLSGSVPGLEMKAVPRVYAIPAAVAFAAAASVFVWAARRMRAGLGRAPAGTPRPRPEGRDAEREAEG